MKTPHHHLINKAALPLLLLALFLALLTLFTKGLQRNPRELPPSTKLNQPIPAFKLPTLQNKEQTFNQKIFKNHISLLNVWATWCSICRIEHPFLMDIVHAANKEHVFIYGLNYKDDRTSALIWLKQHGNPYRIALYDPNGDLGLNLGVYGTPEIFLIDKQGVIRYRYLGALTTSVWQKKLLPLIHQLR